LNQMSPRPPTLLWPLIACLYISQGIPFGLAMEALPTALRHAGTELATLAWLPLVGLPWVLKWSWAAWVDNHWAMAAGRRRSWILPMQAIVLGALLGVWFLGISADTLPWLLGLAVTASLASATQDVATDALVAEQFPSRYLPTANGIQVASTMVGFFYGGPVFLMIYGRMGQAPAMLALALPICVSLLLALAWREPATQMIHRSDRASLLRFFLSGRSAWLLVAAAFLSAVTVVACHSLGKLLLADAHWPLAKIGQIGTLGGVMTILLGCGGGAWLVRRLGAWPAFHAGIAAAGLAAATWAWLASHSPSLPVAVVGIATLLASFGAGCASVAIMTAAMDFTRRRHQAGTDMTMVQSSRDFGEMAASSVFIALAAQLGYVQGFLLGLALAALTLCAALPMLGVRRKKHHA